STGKREQDLGSALGRDEPTERAEHRGPRQRVGIVERKLPCERSKELAGRPPIARMLEDDPGRRRNLCEGSIALPRAHQRQLEERRLPICPRSTKSAERDEDQILFR